MTRDEMTINSDDLGDIFGTSAPEKASPVVQPKKEIPGHIAIPVEIKKEEKKSVIVQSKFAEMELAEKAKAEKKAAEPAQQQESASEPANNEAEVDDLVKRAKEIEEELKGSKPAAVETPELSYKEAVGAGHVAELLGMFEEIRRAMHNELNSMIDKKAVENMLLRTLEKSALSSPILKNTNWNHDGNLRIDGSIDTERLIKNIDTCAGALGEVDVALEEALSGLLYLRIKSVKLGMGKEKYAALCLKINEKTGIIEAGYSAATSGIMKNRIIKAAIKKGDEEQ